MAQTKTDSITFKTQKTLGQLADALRQAAQQLKASDLIKIEDDDPLAGIGQDADQPDIAVALSGKVGFAGGLKHFRAGAANNIWGVQVYVYDLGNERAVELVALGQSVFTDAWRGRGWNGAGVLNLGASKEKRDQLVQMML